jgi:hypothetical protein
MSVVEVRRKAAQLMKQHYTFYDFIINKARGKSGPLFNFDVHDDIRMLSDATREKDEVSRLPGERRGLINSHMLERLWRDHGIIDSNMSVQLL